MLLDRESYISTRTEEVYQAVANIDTELRMTRRDIFALPDRVHGLVSTWRELIIR